MTDIDTRATADIVIVARHPFGNPPLGDWHMARALAADGQVLYVEPPLTFRASVASLSGAQVEPFSVVDDRLARLTPLSPPRADQPMWGDIADLTIGWQLAREVRKRFSSPPVIVTFDPRRGTLPQVPRQMLVHWRRDRFAHMTNVPNLTRLVERDVELMRKADFVCGTTPTLVDEARRIGATAIQISNGCDVAHFRVSRPRPVQLATGTPVAIFAGGAPWRLDLQLVAAVADLMPDWTFVFVGPNRDELPSRSNIIAVGRRPYDDIPGWLQHADVGIIPYDTSLKINEASFPLKALEYLASGTPVVSTCLEALARLTPWIRRCDDATDFASALRHALRDGPTAAECQAFASRHSWRGRAIRLRRAIDEHRAKRK